MRPSRSLLLAALCSVLVASPGFAVRRPRCLFGAGALPAQTSPNKPHGSRIPIDNIVLLMQENRSFDHYFGQLHFHGQRRSRPEPPGASNPNPLGGAPIVAFHDPVYCECADLDHSWTGTHHEWNGGAMDGFTPANTNSCDRTGSRTMAFYLDTDLPFYYTLYANFAMGDRYFASTLTQTFPNRFYFLAGTSFGHIANDFPTSGTEFSQKTIFEELDQAGVTWKIYFEEEPFAFLFAYVRSHAANTAPIAQFFMDAQNGALPQVTFIDPIFNLTGQRSKNQEDDEHPPSNVQVGQQFVASVVNAMFASPQWGRSALFITYDEHGGFYDHVPPPPACVPDNIPPMLGTNDAPGAFDRYGIRVPVVVVSPFSRPRFVSHRVYDHTSLIRFVETRFDLPALTARDANADPMLRFFRFRTQALFHPPGLAPAVVDQGHANAECASSTTTTTSASTTTTT